MPNAVQWSADTQGRLTAGGGNVALDVSGIVKVPAPAAASFSLANRLKFYRSSLAVDANEVAFAGSYSVALATHTRNGARLGVRGTNGTVVRATST